MVGGTDPDTRENMTLVESFDLQSWKRWSDELNIGREGPGVIQVQDTLWVVGGRGLGVNGSVEVYQKGKWTIQEHSVKHENQEYLLAILEAN